MRQAEFKALQKLYREAYRSCLAACGNRYDPALPAVQRLIRLMAELDAMHGALVLTQPDRILHFLHGLDEVCPCSGCVTGSPHARAFAIHLIQSSDPACPCSGAPSWATLARVLRSHTCDLQRQHSYLTLTTGVTAMSGMVFVPAETCIAIMAGRAIGRGHGGLRGLRAEAEEHRHRRAAAAHGGPAAGDDAAAVGIPQQVRRRPLQRVLARSRLMPAFVIALVQRFRCSHERSISLNKYCFSASLTHTTYRMCSMCVSLGIQFGFVFALNPTRA